MTRKPTAKELDYLRASLEQARAVLTGDIHMLEKEALGTPAPRAGVEGDPEGYSLELNLELLERDGSALREVDEALARLAAGNYGACETCQEWIARERLRAVPHARKCIECQRQAEIEDGR